MVLQMVYGDGYVPEVDISLIDTDQGWTPCITMEDAYKIDEVRESLRKCDIERISKMAWVFTLTPVEK